MRWTRTIPLSQGWYWFRRSKEDGPHLLIVKMHYTPMLPTPCLWAYALEVGLTSCGHSGGVVSESFKDGEWSDAPLSPPEE